MTIKYYLLANLFFVFGLHSSSAFSQVKKHDLPPGIYEGLSGTSVTLTDVAEQAGPGQIWIVSEYHDQSVHHQNQVLALNEFSKFQNHISVGFEFYETPDQPFVDQFVSGALSETDFLKAIKWGSIPFDFYRTQTLFPTQHGGNTVALNAPRTLTSRIAKVGMDGLTDAEKQLLPPNFTLGNALYRERFAESMGGHVPESLLQKYFEAQSTWDEIMANSAVEFMKSHSEQTLVILVGDFHAMYGGGLPDRLRARGAFPVKVISQVLDSADVTPDSKYGVRADYVWLSQTK